MLHITLPLLFPQIRTDIITGHTNYVVHLYDNKGPEYLIRYLKSTQESLESYLFKIDSNPEYKKVNLGLDHTGWPKWFGKEMKEQIDSGNIESIRYLFTLSAIRRIVKIKTLTNLQSVTDSPSIDPTTVITHIVETVKGNISDITKKVRSPMIGEDTDDQRCGKITTYRIPRLQVSLKSSPNGVSFFSFPWDRAAIISHDLQDKLEDFASIYFSGESEDWIQSKLDPYEELEGESRQLHCGKINLIHEAGKLKPRVFAIIDSLTQTLLSEFHSDLMRITTLIPEDCTYNHSKVVASAKAIDRLPGSFYGYADLSSATDRIPKQLYEEIGNLLRPGLGSAWVALFDRDFHVSNSVRHSWNPDRSLLDTVRYKVGQPMGALSSWPFMVLVHHTIVWTAFGSRNKSKGKYHILGDDIVIFDENAYRKYLVLLDGLGLDYTNNFSTVGFEFAKRFFYKGEEVTGVCSSALYESRNKPEIFALEWRNLLSRGHLNSIDLPLVVARYLQLGNKKLSRIRLLMSVPYGSEIKLDEFAKWICDLTGRSTCFLSRGNGEQLVEATKCFRQVASILIKQEFQKTLDTSKEAIRSNVNDFCVAFGKYSGLVDQYNTVIQSATNEYQEESLTRVRALERDLKNLYLKPTDEGLLRPSLPDLPRKICFESRDKHLNQVKFEAKHHSTIINALRG